MFSDFKSAQKVVGFTKDERPKGDFYSTPDIAINKLLDAEAFGNSVWEPACGNGAISKILLARGYNVASTDLYDWGYGESGKDFLTEPLKEVDAVVTNPPFNISTKFAWRALEAVKARNGKVALLSRIQWLEGISRKELFTTTPICKILVFSKRLPRMHKFDFVGKPGSNMLAFAWYIWDYTHVGNPTINWI